MKKLLSILMLLVAIVTGAQADPTWSVDFTGNAKDWTLDATQAVEGYGTLSLSAEVGDKTDVFGTAGAMKFSGNGVTLTITLPEGKTFKAGDKLDITVKGGKSSSATYMSINDGALTTDELPKKSTDVVTSNLEFPADFTATNSITIKRGTGGGIYLQKVIYTDMGSGETTDPKITASNASVTATESGVAATVEVPVTGAYLTVSTLTASLSGAPTGMSVALDQNAISEGAISATATVSYTATENANGTATLTFSDGTTTKDVTITYVSKVETVELQSVSEETVWDFSKLTVNKSSANYNSKDDAIKLDEETSPKSTDEIVYTNYDGTDFTIGTDFDGSSIAFTGQYPIRKNSFSQNGTIKIKPSVAGTIIVKFTDTGSSASKTAVKRYLVVNGEQTEYWTSRENNGDEPYDAQLNVTTGEISVPAGEVTITGSSAICVSYVKFTPAAAPTTETITIPSDGVLTYVTQNALDFSTINGAFKAYVPTSVNEAKTSVATAEVTSVPAGTAVLLKGAAGAYDVEIAESATAPAANLFQVSDGSVAGGDNIFAYSKTNKKFQKVKASVTIPTGKCYLVIEGVSGDALDLDFEGEATAIENVNANENANAAAPVKVIKNGKLYIGNYNVAGQLVK